MGRVRARVRLHLDREPGGAHRLKHLLRPPLALLHPLVIRGEARPERSNNRRVNQRVSALESLTHCGTQAAPEPGGPPPRGSERPPRPSRPGQLCRCQAGDFGHAAPQQPVFPCRRSHAEHLCRTHGGTVFGQKEALRGVPLGAKSRRRLPRASAGLGQPVGSSHTIHRAVSTWRRYDAEFVLLPPLTFLGVEQAAHVRWLLTRRRYRAPAAQAYNEQAPRAPKLFASLGVIENH